MFSRPMTIDCSIIIEKPVDTVFPLVADFSMWKIWSTWLSREPDCTIKISGTPGQPGHSLFWDGKTIGSSETKLVSINAPKKIEYDFTFLRPWKTKSKVTFEFSPVSSGTKVTWIMQGSLPMILLPLREKMESVLKDDFTQGLVALKQRAESNTATRNA